LHLNLPLSFYNSGPTPVWAVNMRLRFSEAGLPTLLTFVATRPGVQPKSDDERPLATQVALAGREARVICCEFIQRDSTQTVLPIADLRPQLEVFEARTWGGGQWRDLGVVPIRITQTVKGMEGNYVAHENAPD
jgi:hypothetical protein